MVIRTIEKINNTYFIKEVEDNGISYTRTMLSIGDLIKILIAKGVITEDDIKL